MCVCVRSYVTCAVPWCQRHKQHSDFQEEQERAEAEQRIRAAIAELAHQTVPGCMLPGIAKLAASETPSVRAAAITAMARLLPSVYAAGQPYISTLVDLLDAERVQGPEVGSASGEPSPALDFLTVWPSPALDLTV